MKILTLVLIFASSAIAAFGCKTMVSTPEWVVLHAEIAVRATAVRYIREPNSKYRDSGEIEFKVEEVLKGENVPASITLSGYLNDEDDYNDLPVPYPMVRKGGRGGNCRAFGYRKGGEYLLFLQLADGKFRTYPRSLAPVNEQIKGKDDAWVLWVREQMKRAG